MPEEILLLLHVGPGGQGLAPRVAGEELRVERVEEATTVGPVQQAAAEALQDEL
jgi:hypothetical protein